MLLLISVLITCMVTAISNHRVIADLGIIA